MSRTLAQLRTDLNVKLTDQGGRILTSTQANVLLNEALYEWCSQTEELKRETAFAVTAREFLIAAPTDIIRLKGAHFLQGAFVPMRIVNEEEMSDMGGFYGSFGAGTPQALMLENQFSSYKLRMFPAPSASSQATTISDAGGISSSDATIGVASVSGLRTPSTWMQCESEKILVQNISGTNLLLCVRGMAGTTAASHADATAITQCDLHVRYVRKAVALSGDNDVPEINDINHQHLVLYALKEALAIDRRLDAALRAESLWNEKIRDAKRLVRRVNAASPCDLLENGY